MFLAVFTIESPSRVSPSSNIFVQLESMKMLEDRANGEGLLCLSDEEMRSVRRNSSISDVYDVEDTVFARGKFATVRRASHKTTGVQYAAKYIKKRRRAVDMTPEIHHEISVLLKCAPSNRVVRLHEVYETNSDVVLVLELAAGGELQRIFDTDHCLNEVEARRAMRQILEGLCYLHEKNIAHLDLKPQNLLLTVEDCCDDIKLCDFGVSRLLAPGTEVRALLGTPDYVAPEVLSYEPISLATDIWSVGVLAYVLLSGYTPFGADTKQQTYLNISQCLLTFEPDHFGDVSGAALDFIKSSLLVNPRLRPTVQDLLQHPWISPKSHILPPLSIKTTDPITTTPKTTPISQRDETTRESTTLTGQKPENDNSDHECNCATSKEYLRRKSKDDNNVVVNADNSSSNSDIEMLFNKHKSASKTRRHSHGVAHENIPAHLPFSEPTKNDNTFSQSQGLITSPEFEDVEEFTSPISTLEGTNCNISVNIHSQQQQTNVDEMWNDVDLIPEDVTKTMEYANTSEIKKINDDILKQNIDLSETAEDVAVTKDGNVQSSSIIKIDNDPLLSENAIEAINSIYLVETELIVQNSEGSSVGDEHHIYADESNSNEVIYISDSEKKKLENTNLQVSHQEMSFGVNEIENSTEKTLQLAEIEMKIAEKEETPNEVIIFENNSAENNENRLHEFVVQNLENDVIDIYVDENKFESTSEKNLNFNIPVDDDCEVFDVKLETGLEQSEQEHIAGSIDENNTVHSPESILNETTVIDHSEIIEENPEKHIHEIPSDENDSKISIINVSIEIITSDLSIQKIPEITTETILNETINTGNAERCPEEDILHLEIRTDDFENQCDDIPTTENTLEISSGMENNNEDLVVCNSQISIEATSTKSIDIPIINNKELSGNSADVDENTNLNLEGEILEISFPNDCELLETITSHDLYSNTGKTSEECPEKIGVTTDGNNNLSCEELISTTLLVENNELVEISTTSITDEDPNLNSEIQIHDVSNVESNAEIVVNESEESLENRIVPNKVSTEDLKDDNTTNASVAIIQLESNVNMATPELNTDSEQADAENAENLYDNIFKSHEHFVVETSFTSNEEDSIPNAISFQNHVEKENPIDDASIVKSNDEMIANKSEEHLADPGIFKASSSEDLIDVKIKSISTDSNELEISDNTTKSELDSYEKQINFENVEELFENIFKSQNHSVVEIPLILSEENDIVDNASCKSHVQAAKASSIRERGASKDSLIDLGYDEGSVETDEDEGRFVEDSILWEHNQRSKSFEAALQKFKSIEEKETSKLGKTQQFARKKKYVFRTYTSCVVHNNSIESKSSHESISVEFQSQPCSSRSITDIQMSPENQAIKLQFSDIHENETLS